MNRTARSSAIGWMATLAFCAAALVLLVPSEGWAQVFAFTREDLIESTGKNPFERFPDGRPRIPDALLERTRELSEEEILGQYKSSEIYGTPRDPQLKMEYDEYLKKRLEELRRKRGTAK